MGTMVKKDGVLPGPLGWTEGFDGELVEVGFHAYDGMSAGEVVRAALERGVGARETLEVLRRLGLRGDDGSEVGLPDVIAARQLVRAELVEEFAVTKEEARALLGRRLEMLTGKLMMAVLEGKVGVAKDLLRAVEVSSKLWGLDRNDEGLAEKLQAEIANVGGDGLGVPRVASLHQERLRAALDKHEGHKARGGG